MRHRVYHDILVPDIVHAVKLTSTSPHTGATPYYKTLCQLHVRPDKSYLSDDEQPNCLMCIASADV